MDNEDTIQRTSTGGAEITEPETPCSNPHFRPTTTDFDSLTLNSSQEALSSSNSALKSFALGVEPCGSKALVNRSFICSLRQPKKPKGRPRPERFESRGRLASLRESGLRGPGTMARIHQVDSECFDARRIGHDKLNPRATVPYRCAG